MFSAGCTRVACCRRVFVSFFVLLAFAVSSARAVQLLPGVYGYGADRSVNSAGYGSGFQIVKVTTLQDRDPVTGATIAGSLRAALTKTLTPSTAPRVIVFEVSGTIVLTHALSVSKPNVTIAGQTAPPPGIALRGAPLVVNANNVLVQHLRIRPGDDWVKDINDNVTYNRDAMSIANGVENVLFDHCTFGWSLDECVEGYYAYNNIAFNRCIFGEPLYIATHLDEKTFSGDRVPQAEAKPFVLSPTTLNATADASDLAVEGQYHRVDTTAVGQYVEYTLTVPHDTVNDRTNEHILVTGISASNRGKFHVEVRLNSNPTPVQTSETFDLYGSSPSQVTFVARGSDFDILKGSTDTLVKVRLVVDAAGTEGGYQLGVDQLSLVQPHAMGPFFRDGRTHPTPPDVPVVRDGKLSIIGSAFAHLQSRGPWVGSAQLVLANNVFYNRTQRFIMLGISTDTSYAAMNAAIQGNTFIEGRSWTDTNKSPIMNNALPSGSLIYVPSGSNAYFPAVPSPGTPPAVYNGTTSGSDPTSTADGMSGFVPAAAADAYAAVVLNAGAWPGYRDAMESRIAGDIAASAAATDYTLRQGVLKNTVAEAGGWPVYAETTQAWNDPANMTTIDPSGYTNLELYLQQLAAFAETVPSAPPTSGAVQAETGTVAGGATIDSNNAGFAGTGFINFPVTGGSVTITHTFSTAGTRVLRFRYAFAAAGSRTGELVINGGTPVPITFEPTGSFTNWQNKDVTITGISGSNTIMLRSTGQDLANIDEMAIYVPTTTQAESAVLSNAATETTNAGYHGTSYVNFQPGAPTASTVTFNSVQSGPGNMLQIRYALGGTDVNRTGELVVNGKTQVITFPNTGAFTTWVTMTVPVTLNAGTANTIVLRAIKQDLANVDEILVY